MLTWYTLDPADLLSLESAWEIVMERYSRFRRLTDGQTGPLYGDSNEVKIAWHGYYKAIDHWYAICELKLAPVIGFEEPKRH